MAIAMGSPGEGWGRPHVEAMSMALPVIATNWSGSTDACRRRDLEVTYGDLVTY